MQGSDQIFNTLCPIIKIETFGKIEGGKLSIHGRKRFEEDLRECKDQEVIITVKKRGRRSDKQNRWYWGIVVTEIRLRLKELGHNLTADEVHTFLKEKFNPVNLISEHGELIATFPGSTTEFNKIEFSDYCERIRDWAAQTLEIVIPDADSSLALDF